MKHLKDNMLVSYAMELFLYRQIKYLEIKAPERSGKTSLVGANLLRRIAKDSAGSFLYVTAKNDLTRMIQKLNEDFYSQDRTYYGVVGGPLHTMPIDYLVIDDPFISHMPFEVVIAWIRETAMIRLDKGGRVLIISSHRTNVTSGLYCSSEGWTKISVGGY